MGRRESSGLLHVSRHSLSEDFELDEEGLRHNIDALAEMGCAGLVVGGVI